MNFAEAKERLPTLSTEERASVLQCLQAGVSVEELYAIKAAIDAELDDPSPTCAVEEADLESWSAGMPLRLEVRPRARRDFNPILGSIARESGGRLRCSTISASHRSHRDRAC